MFLELSERVTVAVDEIAAVRWSTYDWSIRDASVIVTLRNGKEFGRWWPLQGTLTEIEANTAAETFYRLLLRQLGSLVTLDIDA